MTQANKLIVIGGLSCAGKSHLIKKIQKKQCPNLSKQLGITTSDLWTFAHANEIKNIAQQKIERLVVHYDAYKRMLEKNKLNDIHELILNSQDVTVLTLCVPPDILIKRVNIRLVKLYMSLFFKPMENKISQQISWHWNKRKTYKNKFTVYSLYEKWFSNLEAYHIKNHLLLNYSQSNNNSAQYDYKAYETMS